jgi:LysR family transcriptional regulator of gallate degradation
MSNGPNSWDYNFLSSGIGLRQIRYLMVVADSGSFSRAAQRFNVSQPALSKAIRELESNLQMELLHRSPQGITLTEAGKALYAHGITIAAELTSARQELNALRNAPNGLVTIGALRAAAISVLPKVTIAFAKTHPDVRLRIVEFHSPELMAGLDRGQFDFAIGLAQPNLKERGIQFEFLFHDRLSIIGRKDHPIWRRKVITPEVMRLYPWILPRPGHFHRKRFDDMFLAAGLEPLSASIECGELEYVRATLAESDYLALVPKHSLSFEYQFLTVHPVESEFMQRSIGFLFPENRSLSPAATAVMEEIRLFCRSAMGEAAPQRAAATKAAPGLRT